MISESPYKKHYEYEIDEIEEKRKIDSFIKTHRKTVVIQGLGFVGAAMMAVVSNAKDSIGDVLYNVIGIDLPDAKNYWKIGMVNEFQPPINSADPSLRRYYKNAKITSNLMATYSEYVYEVADIVIVDIHLDITKNSLGDIDNVDFTYESFLESMRAIAKKVREETLILIETTVPPGTTEKIVQPLFKQVFKERRLNTDRLYIAHSYERVTPGANYVASINNFYRVYSGINDLSKIKAREFLETIINTKDYPLCELKSTNASEMAKVLENSYRALNIAFIQEWTEFAELSGVDLFEVISAIRKRPTHNNIMLPGFGVGGYCLTKDALLADWALKHNFNGDKKLFYSTKAIQTNDLMPTHTFQLIKKEIVSLPDVDLVIMGVSYLSDVGDSRFSPSELFYELCVAEKVKVHLHDPMLSYWKEKQLEIHQDLSLFSKMNVKIAVFTVNHKEYSRLSPDEINLIFPRLELLVDASNVISDDIASKLRRGGIKTIGVGKGHWK